MPQQTQSTSCDPKKMLCASLLLAVVFASAPCSTDLDCSLNGRCSSSTGACACHKPWRGSQCEILGFKASSSVKTLVPQSNGTSWGGSIIKVNDTYHGYFCSTKSIPDITNAHIIHGSSPRIEGPYNFSGVVGRAEGPSMIVQKFSNSSVQYVLWSGPDGHEDDGYGPVRVADQPEGPFTNVPFDFPRKDSKGHCTCFDPAPMWLNDTWFVTCQIPDGSNHTRPPYVTDLIIYHSATLAGPWQVYSNSTLHRPTGQWIEDPFLWTDEQGNWHLLSHAYNLKDTISCARSTVSAHAFSRDGKDWHLLEPYLAPYGHTIEHTDGTTKTYSTLERPKIHFSGHKMTHLVLAADGATEDEGCAARVATCLPGGSPPPCACVNCKWDDGGDTIAVRLDS
jgi:hypothetical protein